MVFWRTRAPTGWRSASPADRAPGAVVEPRVVETGDRVLVERVRGPGPVAGRPPRYARPVGGERGVGHDDARTRVVAGRRRSLVPAAPAPRRRPGDAPGPRPTAGVDARPVGSDVADRDRAPPVGCALGRAPTH